MDDDRARLNDFLGDLAHRPHFYALDPNDPTHTPIPLDRGLASGVNRAAVLTWAHNFDSPHRIVQQTWVHHWWWVSTVFLGLDHAFGGGLPLLFETMVFDRARDSVDDYSDRYSTWDEAIAGHWAIVALVRDRPVTPAVLFTFWRGQLGRWWRWLRFQLAEHQEFMAGAIRESRVPKPRPPLFFPPQPPRWL